MGKRQRKLSTLRIPTEVTKLNSAILHGHSLTDPELRNTPDGNNRIASFLVQFPASKSEDAPFRIKVTAWNNLADKAIADIKKGSQLIVEGRLRLDTVDRGSYKEKRTELVASNFHAIAAPKSQPVPVAPIAPQVTQQSTQEYDDIPY